MKKKNATIFKEKVEMRTAFTGAGTSMKSQSFSLNSDPSTSFTLKFTDNGGFQRSPMKVILQESKDNSLIRMDVAIWFEDTDGNVFGEHEVWDHPFRYAGSNCIFMIEGKNGNMLYDRWEEKRSTKFCCKLTPATDFRQLLWTTYSAGLGYDVTIQIDAEEFKVSSLILMSQSEVFKAMLSSDNFNEGQSKKIHIRNVSAATVEAFIRYLYLAEIENEQAIEELFALSDKYMIKDLKDRCANLMTKTLTKDNASKRLVLSQIHKDKNLEKNIVEFIHKMGSHMLLDIFDSDVWHNYLNTTRVLY